MCVVCSNFINKASQGWVSLFWKVFFGKNMGILILLSIHLIHSTSMYYFANAFTTSMALECYKEMSSIVGTTYADWKLSRRDNICIIIHFAYTIFLCPLNSIYIRKCMVSLCTQFSDTELSLALYCRAIGIFK